MLNEVNMSRSELVQEIHTLSHDLMNGNGNTKQEGPITIEMAYLGMELARKSQIDIDMWLTWWFDGETDSRVGEVRSWTLRLMKAIERRMKFKRFIKSL